MLIIKKVKSNEIRKCVSISLSPEKKRVKKVRLVKRLKTLQKKSKRSRGWSPKFATGLNVIIDIDQKIIE